MKFNLSQSTVSLYESGDRLPDIETIIQFARFFDVSTDYLLDISDIRYSADKLVIDNLSPEEAELVADCRTLLREDRGRLRGYLDCLCGR